MKTTSLTRFLLAGSALATASLLLGPAREANAFSKLGGNLNVNERDFRIFDNFADGTAHDNGTPDANFPGSTGLELAIWKGVVEWGTGHGDGSGDPTQAFLGSGNADFEPAWMGRTSGIGNSVDNITSAIGACGGGTLAFTEINFQIGWRIRFCENWTWSDGPGGIPGGQFDLQGIMTHEYGHALGLGHSGNGSATMFPSASSGSTGERSINSDDIAGLQCIYGTRSANKPTVTGASYQAIGRFLTIDGTFFSSNDNDVWFTPENDTPTGADPRVIVSGLDSTNGGTRIVVQVPDDAGPGAFHVRIDDTGHYSLSNSWPLDPVDAMGPLASATLFNGSGTNPLCLGSTTLPILGTTWRIGLNSTQLPGNDVSGVLAYESAQMVPIPTMFGEYLVNPASNYYGTLTKASNGFFDEITLDLPASPALLGRPGIIQGFLYDVDGNQIQLCNAELITLGL